MEKNQEDTEQMRRSLEEMKKKYAKESRKLEKCLRRAKVKAHREKKIQEHNKLLRTEKDGGNQVIHKVQDILCEGKVSGLEKKSNGEIPIASDSENFHGHGTACLEPAKKHQAESKSASSDGLETNITGILRDKQTNSQEDIPEKSCEDGDLYTCKLSSINYLQEICDAKRQHSGNVMAHVKLDSDESSKTNDNAAYRMNKMNSLKSDQRTERDDLTVQAPKERAVYGSPVTCVGKEENSGSSIDLSEGSSSRRQLSLKRKRQRTKSQTDEKVSVREKDNQTDGKDGDKCRKTVDSVKQINIMDFAVSENVQGNHSVQDLDDSLAHNLDFFVKKIQEDEVEPNSVDVNLRSVSNRRRASFPFTAEFLHLSEQSTDSSSESFKRVTRRKSVGTFPKRMYRTKKDCVVLQSVFQYMIDDAKRKMSVTNDFELPVQEFGNLIISKQEVPCQECLAQDESQEKALDKNSQTSTSTLDSQEWENSHHSETIRRKSRRAKRRGRGRPKTPQNKAESSCNSVDTSSMIADTGLYDVQAISKMDAKDEISGEKEGSEETEKQSNVPADHNDKLLDDVNSVDTHGDGSLGSQVLVPSSPSLFSQNANFPSPNDHQANRDVSDVLCEMDGGEQDDMAANSDEEEEDTCDDIGDDLLHLSCFKIPAPDKVLRIQTVGILQGKKPVEVIICLCERSLSVWIPEDFDITCLQKWEFPEDYQAVSGDVCGSKSCRILYVVMLENGYNKSMCLAVFEEEQAHSLSDLARWTDVVQYQHILWCETGMEYLVSCSTEQERTCLTKYILESDGKQISSSHDITAVPGTLDSLHLIHGLSSAVLGHVTSATIHVWNHALGTLLITIDITSSWFNKSVLTSVTAEKGYLICCLVTKDKSKDPGCLFVINPTNQKSAVLHHFESSPYKWSGCTSAVDIEDSVAAVDRQGTLWTWNKFSGELTSKSHRQGLKTLCLTKHYAVTARDSCVHIFKR